MCLIVMSTSSASLWVRGFAQGKILLWLFTITLRSFQRAVERFPSLKRKSGPGDNNNVEPGFGTEQRETRVQDLREQKLDEEGEATLQKVSAWQVVYSLKQVSRLYFVSKM